MRTRKKVELPRARLTLEIREPGKPIARIFHRAKSGESVEEAAEALMRALELQLWMRAIELDSGRAP